jgi:ADP-ribose pyrophosphatase YjhB (NUDIX family)
MKTTEAMIKDPNGLTEKEFLSSYKAADYRHPSLTSDAVILTKSNKRWQILMIKRAFHPCINCYALPGGFVNDNESSYDSCKRELMEETALNNIELSTLGMFSEPNRDPRDWVVTEAFVAKVDKEKVIIKAGDDAKEAVWFDLDWTLTDKNINVRLNNGKEELTAKVEILSSFSGFDNHYDVRINDNSGIAFDHAKIIATVIAKYLVFHKN